MLHRNTHAVKSFRYSGHIKTHPNSPRDAQIISNQSPYPLIKLRFLNVKSNHEFLIKARYNTACRQIRIIVSLLKRLVKSHGLISFQMFTNKIWLSKILTIVALLEQLGNRTAAGTSTLLVKAATLWFGVLIGARAILCLAVHKDPRISTTEINSTFNPDV